LPVRPVTKHHFPDALLVELQLQSYILNSLSNAFDPAVQRAHDEDRVSRSLANTQLLTLSQQLRDAQACNDKLHDQLFDLRNRLHESQHTTDRAKLRLEMMHAP